MQFKLVLGQTQKFPHNTQIHDYKQATDTKTSKNISNTPNDFDSMLCSVWRAMPPG